MRVLLAFDKFKGSLTAPAASSVPTSASSAASTSSSAVHPSGFLDSMSRAGAWMRGDDAFSKDAGKDSDSTVNTMASAMGYASYLPEVTEAVHGVNLPALAKHTGVGIAFDLSVPVSRVAEFIATAKAACERAVPGARIVVFGHAGDGNLHYTVVQPEGSDTAAFMARRAEIVRLVDDLTHSMNGSFSAEHGIGMLKRPELAHYEPPVALDLMRAVKRALDPRGIMNPGKVL